MVWTGGGTLLSLLHGLGNRAARGTAMNAIKNRLLGRWLACALLGASALSAPAFAQTLDLSIELPLEYTEGDTVPAVVTIDRIDTTAVPDSNVTAMGIEIDLPPGWTLARDPSNGCSSTFAEEQGGSPVNPVNNAVAVFKDAAQTYADPPSNTTCIQLPFEGFGLEFIWIPNNGGAADGLPIDFPVELTVPLVAGPLVECGLHRIDGIVRYRVLTGSEQTNTGIVYLNECEIIECTNPFGDANADGNLDIDDVQYLFEYVIAVVPSVDEFCNDVCSDTVIDVNDVQGLFNMIIQLPNPCQK
jgi:hypothetical protein